MPIALDAGFPQTTFKNNAIGGTITSPAFTVGGNVRTLVLVYTEYTTGDDPWPISCAWVGGTPGAATDWVLRAWNSLGGYAINNPNRHTPSRAIR